MRINMELVAGDRITADGQVYEVKTAKPWMASIPTDDDFQPGDFRMDLETERLVRLVRSHYTEDELFDMEGVEDMPWTVEDVLSGQIYTRTDDNLGLETWNEMETLAWAAEEHHPDTEISGD